jgi:uncharacterized protein (TIGR03000 family)
MYSVVMMMALSGGTEVADFGRRGSCSGGCNGGYAGCYGGYGGCNGGYGGCYGSCYGGGYGGCCGGGYRGCYGCSGYGGCYGGCCGGFNMMYGTCHGPAMPGMTPPSGSREKIPTPPVPPSKTSLDNTATILVTLPSEATLAFDGHVTTQTAQTRLFISPPLRPGWKYQYVLRAEMVRAGAPVVVTRTVTVRANEETRVSLDFDSAEVAARR